MPDNQFINLEELSKTTQALLSKINEQSNLKVNKSNVEAIVTEGTKIADIEGVEIYAPEVDLNNYPTYDNLASVATSGSYYSLNDTPILATVATSGSYNDLSDKPSLSTDIIKYIPVGYIDTANNQLCLSSTVKLLDRKDQRYDETRWYSSVFLLVVPTTIEIENQLSLLIKRMGFPDSNESSDWPQTRPVYLLSSPTAGVYRASIQYTQGDNQGYLYCSRLIDSYDVTDTILKNISTPTSDKDAANKKYVDDNKYDDTAISSRISTLENAGYQNSTQVNSAIATAIGNINQFEVAIVTDLPDEKIDTHTIYFKPNSSSGNNIYDEYMYINNNWELIGSTQIDLTPYALSANLATVATSGNYNDLTNIPNLATVATSGDYDDLTDAPVAETDSNVEDMLDSFDLDYTSDTLSPNMWQGGSY